MGRTQRLKTYSTTFPTALHMLEAGARNHPDAEALVCGDDRLSYAAYAAAVGAVASDLQAHGLSGGRVALVMPNSADFAVALMGSLASGAETAPLNPLYTAHELTGILDDCRPGLILAGPETAETVTGVARNLGLPAPWIVGPGARRLTGGAAPLPLPDPDAPGLLQYTGGTTGRPKGVRITHRASAVNVAQRQALVPVMTEDRILAMTPMYHVYASSMGLFAAPLAGAALVILPRYAPDLVLETVASERISFFLGSPTIYNGLLATPGLASADLSSLRVSYSGSAALPAETLAAWERRSGSVVCEGYGQTECGPVLTSNPSHGPRKTGSVGPALPDTELQIVDVETGTRVLPHGQTGEIRARGPQVMLEYLNRPEETAAALRDGWVHTGDLGEMDADGYLFVRDRKKDMVIVSGFNVYPREIEEELYALPGVIEAAVFGVPDPRTGERLVAHAVAPGLTPEDLGAHLAARLTRYKQPREIVLVDSLPKTAIGKIDKPALRAAAR